MRSLSVRVNEHAIRGSSLHVLRTALLREIRRQARRQAFARSVRIRSLAEYELDAAIKLARQVGLDDGAIREAATPRIRGRFE